jgi:PPOX class probable F420-dependent enzyme
MDKALQQFEGKSYMNIETFRKNGQGVKTPVWFVQDGTSLRVWTFAGAGKIKRIRRDGSVRITPSDASGAPLGEWVSARAIADDSTESVQYVEKLMRKKYGWQFTLFNGLGKLRKSRSAVLKVDLEQVSP